MLKFQNLSFPNLTYFLLSVYVATRVRIFQVLELIYSSASKDKDFAFAFLPLTTPDGPVVSDSEHVLPLYSLPKAEEGTFYLKQDQSAKLLKLIRKGEQIKVKTLLSSTKLTTDGNVPLHKL